MFIGSNNTLTYLEPLQWWLKPFKWIGMSQSLTYEEQYKYCGVRLFDFKVSMSQESGHLIAKHGKFKYPIFSFYEILNFCNQQGDIIVMITLDESCSEFLSNDEEDKLENKFIDYCKNIEIIYDCIKFCGGCRLFDGKKLYSFAYEIENGMPQMIDAPCCKRSWLGKLIDYMFPSVVSRRNRKLIKSYAREQGYLMLDYVNLK